MILYLTNNTILSNNTILNNTIIPNNVKPGSHERHKHEHKINTKTKHDFFSGTCEDKTTRNFHCFAFCSVLGLCLDYDLMLITILMSQA